MGKASSSKKVARAARAGGRVTARQPRSLLFPGVLTVIVLLGVALVVYARNDRLNQDLSGPPQLGDHIHIAFAANVCGQFIDPIPEFESPIGIHTHGDGVLHIHPFSALGVGANATIGLFFKDARDGGKLKMDITNSKLTYAGSPWEEGKTKCDGVKDPVLRMAWWDDVQAIDSSPIITTGDFANRRLTTNGAGITLFFGAADAEIPKPPSGSQLAELGARDGGDLTSTTVAGDTSSTTVAPDGSTTSTAPDASSSSTTTAAP